MPEPAGCQACRASTDELLDLGRQPVCNRFPATRDEDELTHPFRLHACRACGLVQLAAPVPADELRPRVPWIVYREPDAHLDRVADRIAGLPGLTQDARVLGVSQYDGPLLDRLRERGFGQCATLDWADDLGIDQPHSGIETLQAALAAGSVTRPPADVVVARYVVEHAHDLRGLLAALRGLARPGGHLVVEVPDCAPPLERADYSTLWEEHVLYFTSATLATTLAAAGLAPVAELRPEEASAIVSIAAVATERPAPGTADDERRRADSFAARLPETRDRWRSLLAGEGRVAMLGAGHAGIVWLNALGLHDRVACVIDDHPGKQGLVTPGSRLPIVPSSHLADADACVLAVAPAAEDRVAREHEEWVRDGGRFHSITPGSPRHPFDREPAAA